MKHIGDSAVPTFHEEGATELRAVLLVDGRRLDFHLFDVEGSSDMEEFSVLDMLDIARHEGSTLIEITPANVKPSRLGEMRTAIGVEEGITSQLRSENSDLRGQVANLQAQIGELNKQIEAAKAGQTIAG